MIVPYAPGGPTDIVGRIIAQKLGERLGVTVVVDNRPGGTGVVGGEMVAKAAPDGYTLLLCSTSTVVTSPILMAKPPYDALRDLAPITIVVSIPYLLLVHPSSGIGSVKELVALAKAKPGTLNYGSAGTGSTSHLAGAMLGKTAGIDVVHVPYKGSAMAATDLIGGQLQFIFEAIAAGMQYVKSGRLRALGISTLKRVPTLPELPTISEAGVPGYEVSTWHGICAPGATPSALINRLNREIIAVINAPDARDRLTGIGAELVGSSPQELRTLIETDIPRWTRLIREIGAKGN
jgi:tripartite-type tricarboxylate transporter receptor subunit TctC